MKTKEQELEDKPWELKAKYNIFLFGWRYMNNEYRERPDSVCPLFWKGSLGLIFFLLTPLVNLFSLVKSIINKDSFLRTVYYEDMNGIGRLAIQIMIFIGYFAMVIIVTPNEINPFNLSEIPLWILLWGWLLPIVGMLIFVGGIYLVYKVITKLSKKTFKMGGNLRVVTEAVKGKVNNMCPRITWKD
jgi:hypothetical protein